MGLLPSVPARAVPLLLTPLRRDLPLQCREVVPRGFACLALRLLGHLGEFVNGRTAASSSLVYGPSAYSLRACNGRRGLLGHLGELVNGRTPASSSLVYGPSAYSLRACNGRRSLLAHGDTRRARSRHFAANRTR